jgi:hypothetical protein
MKTLKAILKILPVILILVACREKQKPADGDKQKPAVLEFSTLNGLKEKKVRLFEDEIEKTIKAGIFISYPHYLTENKSSEKSINDCVNRNIFNFLISLSEDTAKTVTKGIQEQFEHSSQYCFDENIEAHMNFESPQYQDKNLLSIRFFYSILDYGAAHPNSFWGGLSFDKATGQNILLHDVLKEGYARMLKEIIQTKNVIITKDEFNSLTLEDLLPLQESDIEQLQNFWLSDQGIHFRINPYEIGTYVTRGEILFLYKDLGSVLKEKSYIPADFK